MISVSPSSSSEGNTIFSGGIKFGSINGRPAASRLLNSKRASLTDQSLKLKSGK